MVSWMLEDDAAVERKDGAVLNSAPLATVVDSDCVGVLET